MNKPNLTRICLSCNVEKPLSAFLQIAGASGTHYGNICAQCRGASSTSKIIFTTDEKQGGGTGARIGAKQKIQMDLTKKAILETQKETEIKEDKNKQEQFIKETETKSTRKENEKKHHQSFLDTKKQTHSQNVDKKASEKTALKSRIEEAQSAEKAEHQATFNKQEGAQQEIRMTTTDLSVPFLDPQFAEIRFHGPLFNMFKDGVLSGASAIKKQQINQTVKTVEKLYNEKANKAESNEQKPRNTQGDTTEKKPTEQKIIENKDSSTIKNKQSTLQTFKPVEKPVEKLPQENKDPLIEILEKTFGPLR